MDLSNYKLIISNIKDLIKKYAKFLFCVQDIVKLIDMQ